MTNPAETFTPEEVVEIRQMLLEHKEAKKAAIHHHNVMCRLMRWEDGMIGKSPFIEQSHGKAS